MTYRLRSPCRGFPVCVALVLNLSVASLSFGQAATPAKPLTPQEEQRARAAAAAVAATPAPGRAGVTTDEVSQLSTFTVTEQQDIGYESMHTTSGMRTVQELKNLANSISIMNAQLIEDTASLTMDEMATWFVSGESNPEPNAAVDSRVILRGIPNAYAMRNGWIWYSPMDSYSTEKVELLRGPNAFLYGEADVGGAQNQITKRGLFTRKINNLKLMFGSDNLMRAELDLNRPIIRDKLAVRFSAVKSSNDSWIDNVRRDFSGLYAAVTYRPFRKTSISVMAEHAETNSVNSQGLYVDAYSRPNRGTIGVAGGFVYVPATGLSYRAQGAGRQTSTGPGTTIVDKAILPRTFQSAGPNNTFENYYQSITIEAEHHIGNNLHLQVSGNFYQRNVDILLVGAGRNIYRDINATLPNGQANPYFNELYTEYFRQRNQHGNIVKDIRFSAVYDIKTRWMKQQLLVNLQQHQDNPYHRKPKWGEYVDESNPAFNGVINREITPAAFTANRAVFTANRFMRRYYFNRDGLRGNEDIGPVPGVSAWYPDLSAQVAGSGHQVYRRFYTPSWGVGASGTYFNNHLFTHVGYRRDEFNMKTRFTTVRPLKDRWVIDEIPGLFPANQTFVNAKVDGANYGAVLRFNEAFAIGYNYAQSFRISTGEGGLTHRIGERQGVPVGEGADISARLSLFKNRIEISTVYFDNFRPNDRFNFNPNTFVEEEVAAIFPETFLPTGSDYQTTSTKGYEFEMTANLTRNWRMMVNVATSKVVTENRAKLLKGFQAEARAKNEPTPLLDEFLLTYPEGVPNAGYTKARANFFTRYTFVEGALKGAYIGGGANWREPTFRGNGDHDSNLATPVQPLWSPAYTLYSLLAGYRTKVFNRPTTFALNVGNLLDKEYYRSAGVASGSWGEPRSFRLSLITEF